MSRDRNLKNTANVVNTVGQAGCATGILALIIIAIAFGIGWLLDDLLGNERRFLTLAFLLLSFPVTLFAMVRLSLYIVGKANQQFEEAEHQRYENKDDTIT